MPVELLIAPAVEPAVETLGAPRSALETERTVCGSATAAAISWCSVPSRCCTGHNMGIVRRDLGSIRQGRLYEAGPTRLRVGGCTNPTSGNRPAVIPFCCGPSAASPPCTENECLLHQLSEAENTNHFKGDCLALRRGFRYGCRQPLVERLEHHADRQGPRCSGPARREAAGEGKSIDLRALVVSAPLCPGNYFGPFDKF